MTIVHFTQKQIKELEKSPFYERLPEPTPYERGFLARFQDRKPKIKSGKKR